MKTKTPPRVMVVDDEAPMRSIVRRMLEPTGYIVTDHGQPVEACDALDPSAPPDILIADFRMPEMTGDEVARRFRLASPDVKVLFITGFADDLFTERSKLWDGEAFLEKPFNRKGLLEAVSLLLFDSISGESPAVGLQPAATEGA